MKELIIISPQWKTRVPLYRSALSERLEFLYNIMYFFIWRVQTLMKELLMYNHPLTILQWVTGSMHYMTENVLLVVNMAHIKE